MFQDKVCDLAVLFQHFSVDEDVIEVYAHHVFGNKFLEDIVHHCLKGGWAIGESKEHNERFKQSPVGLEGNLPLISLLDAHVVVAPPDIQFGEVPCTPEVVDELRDEGEGVAVLHSHGIENPVEYASKLLSVFLLQGPTTTLVILVEGLSMEEYWAQGIPDV
ncbi:hypothetical protein C0989_005244 [Termitomyces sp. Mn162]|nr:hypothetical protein C0989_005244 [Termitomyces sp. Mn162]